jgi:hypothetical protein
VPPALARDGLRFRLWIDGVLEAERWIDCAAPDVTDQVDAVRDAHAALAAAADQRGQLWLAEVYNPEEPERNAYLRFGTDRDGMMDPLPLLSPWPS